MLRRPSTLALTTSLTLGAAAAVLWATSYGWADGAIARRGGWELASRDGRLTLDEGPRRRAEAAARAARLAGLERALGDGVITCYAATPWSAWPAVDACHTVARDAFDAADRARRADLREKLRSELAVLPGPYAEYSIPYFVLVLAAGLLPAWRLTRAVAAHGSGGVDLCFSCGYDLRATPGRCPECGRAATV